MDILVSQETARVPVTIFRVQGLLNLGTAEQLESRAQQVYDIGARYLLVDLSGVTSLTSAGLRVVLAVIKLFGTAEDKGKVSRTVKLAGPPPNILQVLKIAGFDSFVEIHDDAAKAVASF